MKYLYIKYSGNKRSTVLSDGTNMVLKLDTVDTVDTVDTTTITEYPTLMCANAIHMNHDIALARHKRRLR